MSRDLAHWQRLPFALRPGPEPFDADGAWTGTATPGAGPGGAPALLYSCASGRQPPGFFFQQVRARSRSCGGWAAVRLAAQQPL